MTIYVDADHAHDLVTRRSITGILVILNYTILINLCRYFLVFYTLMLRIASTFHQYNGVYCCSFFALGTSMLRIGSKLLCIGRIPCLVIEYPMYCFSRKELRFGDIHSHTNNSLVESLARIISNLSRWSLKLRYDRVNKSSRLHVLDTF
jgi:hypothetical protein